MQRMGANIVCYRVRNVRAQEMRDSVAMTRHRGGAGYAGVLRGTDIPHMWGAEESAPSRYVGVCTRNEDESLADRRASGAVR
jgi:hypothetical protein